MKKYHYFLLFLYTATVLVSVIFVVLNSLDISVDDIFENFWTGQQFLFSLLFSIFSVTVILLFMWMVIDENSKRHINQSLRRILNNQSVKIDGDSDIDHNLQRLSKKMTQLTNNLQNTKNERILNSQEIVKQERKRIARDLHDTVSQELFASSMILSGISQTIDMVEKKDLKVHIQTVEEMIQHAQNDLRILLLHLRPTELENKSLLEGLDMILRELVDKSNLEVVYQENVDTIPKTIEDNLFRIVQEFISNTLKHAKASRLEVYLYQTETELQLKMADNGIGFNVDDVKDLSYGLKNIKDRVEDLAGAIKILSQKDKGVVMEIRIPLIQEEENDRKN